MKLKELLEQATPLPWILDWGRIRDGECNTVCCSPSQHDVRKWLVDRALIAHAVNMLPKLVAFAKMVETTAPDTAGMLGMFKREARSILKEASNIPS